MTADDMCTPVDNVVVDINIVSTEINIDAKEIKVQIDSEIHKKAFLTNFEMSCEFGIILALGDVIWLFKDMGHNGISFHYITILVLFMIGLVGMIYVLFRHHRQYTHRIAKKKKRIQ
jgi:putative Mn2+ efflux pump MntP